MAWVFFQNFRVINLTQGGAKGNGRTCEAGGGEGEPGIWRKRREREKGTDCK